MSRFFSDEQVRTAIVVLEDEFPGTWESIKQVLSVPLDARSDEIDRAVDQNLSAMHRAFVNLPFIAGARAPDAKLNLVRDVLEMVRSELDIVRRRMN